jgi:hypothetical protein
VSRTLYPMVHVGEHDYFRAVYSDAFSHDVVLAEAPGSPAVRRIVRFYSWIEGAGTINLVLQPAYPPQTSSAAQIVYADLSDDEFERVWRKIPLSRRAIMRLIAIASGAGRRWFGHRYELADALSFDDLPNRWGTLNFDPETIALAPAVLRARDRRLVECLIEQLDDRGSGARRVAVVYGAHHARAVLRALADRGYIVERSRWLTVFRT